MAQTQILPEQLTDLTAISPLDGRYRQKTAHLASFVSEYALIKNRLAVEAKYLIALSNTGIIRKITDAEKEMLLSFGSKLTIAQAQNVKIVEEKTRHDVKAMEIVFRKMVQGASLEDLIEYIHFGLTSEDVNNLSYRLMYKEAVQQVLLPSFKKLLEKLSSFAHEYKQIPMLARTHGQAAVPTTLGKEFAVFANRLNEQLQKLTYTNLHGKLNGAVGNFNALRIAYPETDWLNFSEKFILSLGLKPNLITTQINTYEDLIEYLQIIQRINGILLDLDLDMWRYISDQWFLQEVKKDEAGSSTMPQKVNPILFENSEGNIGIANSLIEYMTRKLPVSRLQRDLSDSTTIRNIGSILGYSYLAATATYDGMARVKPNLPLIEQELNKDWSILAEAVQTIMRKDGVADPYTLIKSLTRGEHLSKEQWGKFVDELPISNERKNELHVLTPSTYIGLASEIVEKKLAIGKK